MCFPRGLGRVLCPGSKGAAAGDGTLSTSSTPMATTNGCLWAVAVAARTGEFYLRTHHGIGPTRDAALPPWPLPPWRPGTKPVPLCSSHHCQVRGRWRHTSRPSAPLTRTLSETTKKLRERAVVARHISKLARRVCYLCVCLSLRGCRAVGALLAHPSGALIYISKSCMLSCHLQHT